LHGKKSFAKLIAMMGGILILAGLLLFSLSALVLFGYLEISLLLEQRYVHLFALIFVIVGLLDTFSAIIISRWR
jgi:UDP-N-acetylmuramyl pentapeptide phosphotransferase/UDP-N-acetylglucosamine-1-phosphate transferase